MPELPEVEAIVSYLRKRTKGLVVTQVDIAAFSALKTYDPPPSAMEGMVVRDAVRYGKFFGINIGELWVVTHLMRAGWLHYRDDLPETVARLGKSPIAARFHMDDGSGFDLTEAGTKKALSIYVVKDPGEVPGIQRLGPDALTISLQEFADRVGSYGGQVKHAITKQSVLAGIGNAYSDEILHAAKLSPFASAHRLSPAQMETLYGSTREILLAAVDRSVGQNVASLKEEKRFGLQVHGRAGQQCPACGDTIREVVYAQRSLQYCPTCQTGGKPLADRRLSRLLK